MSVQLTIPANDITVAAADEIRRQQRTVVDGIAKIGEALIRAKAALPHGTFLPWLQAEFDWTERTAQNFMSVAERFGTNPKRVSYLPLATVYRLASPSTPDDLRDRIVGQIDNGESKTAYEIDSEIKSARREVASAREEAKKSPEARARLKASRERLAVVRRQEFEASFSKQEQRRAARIKVANIIVNALNDALLDELLAALKLAGAVSDDDVQQARSQGGDQ